MNVQEQAPVITVLSASGESPWPGLESLQDSARVIHVTSQAELTDALAETDILLVTDFRAGFLQSVWSHANRIKWVHATSAGVDALLFPELVESETPLTNARGVFDRPIAEYVLGLILLYTKDLLKTIQYQQTHRWVHRDTERLEGRQVVIVGPGSIGRRIAQLLRSTGLKVIGAGPDTSDHDPDFDALVDIAGLHQVLPDADFVVISAPLTPETRGMFGPEEFRGMRPTARLINVARGPIVQTEALIRALEAKEIAGAALDVFEEEPLPPDNPLWDMPGVVLSPHMAGDFHGWREALSDQFITNFQRWRKGEKLLNLVDKKAGYARKSEEE